MIDATVVYCTASAEAPEFEAKIIDTMIIVILRATTGGLPIISVSQKPLAFGTNICVGEVGRCTSNYWRQMLIGVEAARSRWILVAESDVLYPLAYFDPPVPTMPLYRYVPVNVLWAPNLGRLRKRGQRGFYAKEFTEGAQLCEREEYLRRLNATIDREIPFFGRRREWADASCDIKNREPWWDLRPHRKFGLYGDPLQPVLTIKTGRGVANMTGTMASAPVPELPFWGSATTVRERLGLT